MAKDTDGTAAPIIDDEIDNLIEDDQLADESTDDGDGQEDKGKGHQVDKGVQRLQQDVGVLSRTIGQLGDQLKQAVERLDSKPNPTQSEKDQSQAASDAQEQIESVADQLAKLEGLADEDGYVRDADFRKTVTQIGTAIDKVVAKLNKRGGNSNEVAKLQSEIDDLKTQLGKRLDTTEQMARKGAGIADERDFRRNFAKQQPELAKHADAASYVLGEWRRQMAPYHREGVQATESAYAQASREAYRDALAKAQEKFADPADGKGGAGKGKGVKPDKPSRGAGVITPGSKGAGAPSDGGRKYGVWSKP